MWARFALPTLRVIPIPPYPAIAVSTSRTQ
jgi:hypothetical protein